MEYFKPVTEKKFLGLVSSKTIDKINKKEEIYKKRKANLKECKKDEEFLVFVNKINEAKVKMNVLEEKLKEIKSEIYEEVRKGELYMMDKFKDNYEKKPYVRTRYIFFEEINNVIV